MNPEDIKISDLIFPGYANHFGLGIHRETGEWFLVGRYSCGCTSEEKRCFIIPVKEMKNPRGE